MLRNFTLLDQQLFLRDHFLIIGVANQRNGFILGLGMILCFPVSPILLHVLIFGGQLFRPFHYRYFNSAFILSSNRLFILCPFGIVSCNLSCVELHSLRFFLKNRR